MPSPTSNSSCVTCGWCDRCGTEHRLGQGGARALADALMMAMEATGSIESGFPTDYLFGPARGQMFGVLEAADEQGRVVVLRAFSSQYNGVWQVPGWVPPVFDHTAFDRIMIPGDRRIKDLGRQLDALPTGSQGWSDLKRQRKLLSRSLMKDLHALYHLRNFHGETRPLADFFQQTHGIPTGAGDCCAPKLLQEAARRNLHPLGLAEFYWGKTNRSGTREHGQFYASCDDKCQPILGYMLCGAVS